jgi:hypothetical protein
MAKVTRYIISYRMNASKQRRILAKEFKKRSDAVKEIKRILAPGIFNVPGDKRTQRTSVRNTMSFGFNNPRIKMMVRNR